MLTLNEILTALRSGGNVAADVSAIRERFEVEIEDLTGGYKVEQLEEFGEFEMVAEVELLNQIVALLGDAEEALARGDQAGAVFALIKVSTVK